MGERRPTTSSCSSKPTCSARPCAAPDNAETTALGAAYLAGLSTGFWKSTEELAALREGEDRFLPTFDEPMRAARLAAWHEAVSRVRS